MLQAILLFMALIVIMGVAIAGLALLPMWAAVAFVVYLSFKHAAEIIR